MQTQISVNMGEVIFSDSHTLVCSIGTCAVLCFRLPCGYSAMAHISRSRKDDTTPSGKFIKRDNFFYFDRALAEVMNKFQIMSPGAGDHNINCALFGGLKNEGVICEALQGLNQRSFNLIASDINKSCFRNINFNTKTGVITVSKKKSFLIDCSALEIQYKI